MIQFILGGLAATYMHKKFPKQTEAVARGALKAAAWTAKKAGQAVTKYSDHRAAKAVEKNEL